MSEAPRECPDLSSEFEFAMHDAAIQHDPGEAFDKVVLREVSLDRHARTVKFWLPAIVGALVAGLAVLSAVEVVCFSPTRNNVDVSGQEAQATVTPSIPDFREPTSQSDSR